MENNRNYRIRTNVNQDKVLNVNLNQDYDFLEILSLKINQRNLCDNFYYFPCFLKKIFLISIILLLENKAILKI